MFLSKWREFPSAPCLAEEKNLTARGSMSLKSLASLTCFRACFLPGRAKVLSAPRYYPNILFSSLIEYNFFRFFSCMAEIYQIFKGVLISP
jgi:hypothetical protein